MHARARMASHSGIKVMQLSFPNGSCPLALNWPCKNSSCYCTKASYYIRVPKWLKPFLRASNPAVLEWLEPLWHSRNATGHAIMAQAIIALKCSNWQLCSQYGSSRSCTQVMQLAGPEWLKPLWHSKILYLEVLEPFWHLTGSARMARAILTLPVIL